ncbi:reticulocalbin-2-like [Ornithodoros turicata]|uniref:reticulocalbin-2-like n=1 Tax=Ornithodoros turicata TaxID=34597 RepID=UPI003139DB06
MLAANKFCLTAFYLVLVAVQVICHAHMHAKDDDLNKEREKDGSFASRARNHLDDDEHHSEFDHEAILGDKDAAEEYDQLSPDVAKARLKELALKMDKDEDGFVDRRELVQWILRSFRLLTDEEAKERFEEEDKNQDGKVSWEEHVTEAFGTFSQDTYSEGEEDRQTLLEEDDRYFKAADRNHDGLLDQDEYPKFSHPSEFPEMKDILYEETMKKKDLDNDGFLTLEEFMTDEPEKPLHPDQRIAEKERFELDYDKNGDKLLDKEETLAWLLPGNDEIADQEAEHLIGNSDTDKDGKLTIQEIVDHHDIFVGSEATDYGEHLQNTNRFTDEL